MSPRGPPARVSELIRAHAVGRVGKDDVELVWVRGFEPRKAVLVEDRVGLRGKGRPDGGGEVRVALSDLFLLEDLECVFGACGGGNIGIVEVLRDDEFLPRLVLGPSGGGPANFLRNVSGGGGRGARSGCLGST